MEDELNYDERLLQKYLNVLSFENLPSNEEEYKQNDVRIDEIGYLINNLESFVSAASNTFSRDQVISRLTELIVSFGLVPKADTDDQESGPESFPRVAEYAEKCFEYLKILIREVENLENSHKQQFLMNAILLHATHNACYAWTSEAAIQMSSEFSKDLLRCTQHQNFSTLLTDGRFCPTIFERILKKLCPSMWMLHPSSAYLFRWLLHNVKHPYLADYLSDVLTLALMVLLYNKPVEKQMAIECLDYILDNVPPSLITLKEDYIYHNLCPYIHFKDPEIVSVIFCCLLKLPMMNLPKNQIAFWGKFSYLFNHLLCSVQVESDLKLKRLFLTNILIFTEHNTCALFKHLEMIMEILPLIISVNMSMDFSSRDAMCRLEALKILKSIIRLCWTRMSKYCFDILTLILMFNEKKGILTNSDENIQNSISELCEDCIILLKRACYEKFEDLKAFIIEDYYYTPECKYFMSVLAKMTDDP